MSYPPAKLSPTLRAALLSLLVFITAWGVVSWRSELAPDIFTDEIMYTRVAVRVAGEGALVWDNGEPFLIHPPLYFVAQSLYQNFTGDPATPLYSAGEIFHSVWNARGLNAIFAGLTAVLIFLLGRAFQGDLLGLGMAALFLLDPFGVRTNRRAMLETLAALLSLAGMALFLLRNEMKPMSLRRSLVAGLLFGLALLAKEIIFINLVAVLIFGVWEAMRGVIQTRSQALRSRLAAWRSSPVLAVGIALITATATYSIYPLWVYFSGSWDPFMDEKSLGFERMIGLVQLTGWNRPGQSLFSLLLARLADYGSTYLIFALGGLATVGLLLWGRSRLKGRFLTAWGVVAYPFFAFLSLFGSGNDQFFYYLLIPAILICGYSAAVLMEKRSHPTRMDAPVVPGGMAPTNRLGRMRTPLLKNARLLVLVIFGLLLAYNALKWSGTYAAGKDNGYTQLAEYVNTHIPEGQPINASGDPIKFRYFLPGRPIAAAATVAEAQQAGITLFVLAPKDVQNRYGRMEPELARWIVENGSPIFAVYGESYGEILLYQVPTAAVQAPTGALPAGSGGQQGTVFLPAQGNFIRMFSLALLVWAVVVSLVVVALQFGLRRDQPDSNPAEAQLRNSKPLQQIWRPRPEQRAEAESGEES